MKILLLLALSAATSLAQGPLTPPGVPAPAMKSLEQIEGRTPIESLPFTISASGSYYFTKNLVFTATSGNAINITASNVTLDLNGFTLSSSPGVTGNAVNISDSLFNITVKNGCVSGNTTVTITNFPRTWSSSLGGFEIGVIGRGDNSSNIHIDNLAVNGCRRIGITASFGRVTNSTVFSNGDSGIIAWFGSVSNSTATRNGGSGIDAQSGSVTNSVANYNAYRGISVEDGTVSSSTANYNGTGIYANGGSVNNSTASYNREKGIFGSGGSVTGSSANSNGQDGIFIVNGSITNSSARNNSRSSGFFDISAPNSSVAFCRYGVGNTIGSSLTGNKTP